MAGLRIKGVVFDVYGTLVDVGAVAEACKQVASEPVAFNTQWRAKQLEYSFPRADPSRRPSRNKGRGHSVPPPSPRR